MEATKTQAVRVSEGDKGYCAFSHPGFYPTSVGRFSDGLFAVSIQAAETEKPNIGQHPVYVSVSAHLTRRDAEALLAQLTAALGVKLEGRNCRPKACMWMVATA